MKNCKTTESEEYTKREAELLLFTSLLFLLAAAPEQAPLAFIYAFRKNKKKERDRCEW